MNERKNRIMSLGVLFLSLLLILPIINLNSNNDIKVNNISQIYTSAEESYQGEWITNQNFTSSADWISQEGLLGDPDDVDAYISGGEAHYDVLGEERTFSLVETPPIGSNWIAVPNPNFPYGPTSNFSDSEGLKVYHEFDDQDANQNPSVHWDRNFSMPVSMSDYEIKSASIQVVVNATVDKDVDCPGDTEATDGGADLNQRESYDYVRFYVLVSDLSKSKVYEMAYLQPTDLGEGDPWPTPGNDILSDTYLIPYLEDDLIFYLTSVLNTDYYNFTVTLGIRIYTADNSNTYDNDEFHELLIKSVDLTFTYEKKINQQTSVSWNQYGNKISDVIPISYNSFEVIDATLKFKYKVDDLWPTSSPNSEIRIFINNAQHTETVKLTSATLTLQPAKSDGFDVSSLISDDVNLSIQVWITDDFELNRSISISIDDVSLYISYKVLFDDYQTDLQLLLNGDDKTSTPSIELALGQILNITIKYSNQTGDHIPNANVQLTGEGMFENLNETLEQYTIEINVSERLNMGNNYLTIEAEKTNFETKQISLNVLVRKIQGEIMSVSGESVINIASGENFQLQIILNDTDNDILIEGAIVTYTCTDLDPTPKVLLEDNGVYEGIIQNPPDGLYTITISAFAGDDYYFDDFQITLNVGGYVPEPEDDMTWLVYLLIISFGSAIILFTTIFSLYIKYWRYPPLVRKIRSLKKKVRKGKKMKPIVLNKRDEIIKNNIQEQRKILNIETFSSDKIDKITNERKEVVN